MSWPYWAVAVAVWVGAGVLGVYLLLHRRGYREGAWFFLGAVLGPLFAPIAAERADRRSTVLHHRVEVASAPGNGTPGSRLRVLVGVDGSAGSARAVEDAARLVGPMAGCVLLATVIDAECAEKEDAEKTTHSRRLLQQAADRFRAGGSSVETEILSGDPVHALITAADADEADLIVVGRCGPGMTHRLVGSVANGLSASARQPVLLASPPEPAPDGGPAAGAAHPSAASEGQK